jgi:hypothetical protein
MNMNAWRGAVFALFISLKVVLNLNKLGNEGGKDNTSLLLLSFLLLNRPLYTKGEQ